MKLAHLAVLFVLSASESSAAGQIVAADAAIRALYAADKSFIDGKGQGVMGSKALRERFLSKSLLRAIALDERSAAKRKEPPNLEGDPFLDSQELDSQELDSQEPDFKDLKVTPISQEGDRAQVLADFARIGGRETLTYSLVREGGAWRVDDVAYVRTDGSRETLRAELKAK